MTLEQRIQDVEARIEAACERSGRKRQDVNVIAVTKYVSLESTGSAIRAGLTQIGENRWQDAEAKWNAFHDQATWHFIGSLQSNKAKEVVGRFAYIHSLDRLSLAKAIDKQAKELEVKVPCFVQVNVSGEESKQGLAPSEVADFLQQLKQYSHIQPIGLMTMAPFEAEPEETRPVFRGLRELRDELNRTCELEQPLTELSMGMSNDFEVAIEEGATWVRLGSILVGKEGE
ncbi:YggS family pyridoxal phosphate-dependent enzyme [Paenibacillus sp. 1001270B_150601_E10]|uniref:YggS family pyridoxal phosphate-dependent enzyme n=1 Tax=Paenibacillus sp. 1001270B_150601_E10 TaxID=2787079 RepID=UPI00189FA8B0|nr:YggS family pyridoxal phosphate-dependent enzyme [Paenibacillus sp. 1001270B_150601_E10]